MGFAKNIRGNEGGEMKTPEQLAEEHWMFLERWLEMMFKDGFIHGFKHALDPPSKPAKSK